MSSKPWTIDSIAHALPHPELRQTFMREAHLAPLDQLQDVLDRWVRFIGEWEAGRPKLEELRAHVTAHGQMPAEYEAGLIEISPEQLRAGTRGARGAA